MNSVEEKSSEIQSERHSTKHRKMQQQKTVENSAVEVELVLSENECDEKVDELIEDTAQALGTPRRRTTNANKVQTPQMSVVLGETMQIRRSVRKSVKPAQEYDEIVGKRMLRSLKKESNVVAEEEEEQKSTEQQPKWTPAKVGRVSQKRGRKNRRAGGKKQVKKELSENNAEKDGEEKELVEIEKQEAGTELEGVLQQNDNKLDRLTFEYKNIYKDEDSLPGNEVDKCEEIVEVDIKATVNFHPKLGELNVDDMGLVPLETVESSVERANVEDNKVQEEEQVEKFGKAEESDEMPSLIVYDDEGENEDVFSHVETHNRSSEPIVACTETVANDTFNSSDCIILSPAEKNGSPKVVAVNDEDCLTQSLDIDAKTPFNEDTKDSTMPWAKVPKIVITTPGVTVCTPKQRPKAYRFPTPYRNKAHFNFPPKADETESETEQCKAANLTKAKSNELSTTLPLTTMEPKDVVLRSIRKRSLSLCIDGVLEKRKLPRTINRVTFNSPANQTAVIEDFDLLIAKSVKKTAGNQTLSSSIPKPKVSYDTNVTQRRKRSMSFDESLMNSATKLYKPGMTRNTQKKLYPTPQKCTTTTAPAQMRTKLPNFSAIHQKQFNKMENLVDHVARKAERAKVLSSSSTKPCTVSAQKSLPPKNEICKPKAMRKIDLSNVNMAAEATLITTAAVVARPKKSGDNVIAVLSTPRLAIIRPMPAAAVAAPNAAPARKKPAAIPPVKRVLRPVTQVSHAQVTKPAFNLSTAMQVATKPASVKPVSAQENLNRDDKLATRRQRHMEMFKGRTATDSSKKGLIIRGVRSNRRFELQMQHRRNMEMDHN